MKYLVTGFALISVALIRATPIEREIGTVQWLLNYHLELYLLYKKPWLYQTFKATMTYFGIKNCPKLIYK